MPRLLFLILVLILGYNSYGIQDPDSIIYHTNSEVLNLSKVDEIDQQRFQNFRLIPKEKDIKVGITRVNKTISDSLLNQRIARLNVNSPIEFQNNPIVKREIEKYLNTSSQSLAVWMSRSKYYFPLFESELYANNLPLEIKVLPVMESGLNPNIESKAGARGLWQMIYTTAKANGLNMTSYVDERSDPKLATQAASKYLIHLMDIYENWLLALAAYNCGPGNVNKAIRESGGKWNYWEIRPYLPEETRNYIPRFIALNYLFSYAKEHNIGMIEPKFFYEQTDTIKLYRTVPFSFIVENLNISEEDLNYLNPAYLLKIIPGTYKKKYSLVLPVNKIGYWIGHRQELFAKLDILDKSKKIVYPKIEETNFRKTYKVKNGDILGTIAQKFKVKVSAIKKWNNLRSTRLKIGQRLIIYTNPR